MNVLRIRAVRAAAMRLLPIGAALVTLAGRAAAQTDWERLTLPGAPEISAVAIPDGNVVVAVSPLMRILRSEDGGTTWSERDPQLPWALDRGLLGVAFGSATVGIAVGHSSAVTVTTDGGLTWAFRPMNVSAMTSLRNPTMIGATALIPGQPVLRTTDGGDSWTPYVFNDEGGLADAVLIDADTVFAVGPMGLTGTGTILKSVNGGESWSWLFSPPRFGALSAIAMSGPSGAVVGDSGAVYVTSDFGGTWSQVQWGKNYDLLDVAFADPMHAYAVGEGGMVLASTDGGASWHQESTPTGVTLRSVAFRGGLAIVAGDSGTVLRKTSVASVPDEATTILDAALRVTPSPATAGSVVSFSLAHPGTIRLTVVDRLGREVAVLREGLSSAGAQTIPLEPLGLVSGVYFLRMTAGGSTLSAPFQVVR